MHFLELAGVTDELRSHWLQLPRTKFYQYSIIFLAIKPNPFQTIKPKDVGIDKRNHLGFYSREKLSRYADSLEDVRRVSQWGMVLSYCIVQSQVYPSVITPAHV